MSDFSDEDEDGWGEPTDGYTSWGTSDNDGGTPSPFNGDSSDDDIWSDFESSVRDDSDATDDSTFSSLSDDNPNEEASGGTLEEGSDTFLSQADLNSDWDGVETAQQGETESNLSYKTVGVIVAIILVVVAMIILWMSKASVSRKAEVAEDEVEYSEEATQESNGGIGFVEVPDNTDVDYSVNVITEKGKVVEKLRFLEDGVVVYCVKISLSDGDVPYYCGYNVWDAVRTGTTVEVSYRKVSDTCISIDTISK